MKKILVFIACALLGVIFQQVVLAGSPTNSYVNIVSFNHIGGVTNRMRIEYFSTNSQFFVVGETTTNLTNGSWAEDLSKISYVVGSHSNNTDSVHYAGFNCFMGDRGRFYRIRMLE
jgi:hypothetical protein